MVKFKEKLANYPEIPQNYSIPIQSNNNESNLLNPPPRRI